MHIDTRAAIAANPFFAEVLSEDQIALLARRTLAEDRPAGTELIREDESGSSLFIIVAGEVDVIATLGQHLFVLEVKSTFMRRSQQEAWLHASSTLRKAGRQLQRKLAAVSQAIGSDLEFRSSLGLTELPALHQQHGWIVDTCIECDHQRFSGFPGGLKIRSYAEVLEKEPGFVVREAVRRMLPKTRLGKKMLTKLRTFPGADHHHQAQKPSPLVLT